jgi:hypothetical protein
VGSYYYFAATLQTPVFGAAPPLSGREFMERCRTHLSPSDCRVVEAALIASPAAAVPATAPGSPLLARYYAWERSVRNELVRLRARRLERAAEPWLRSSDGDGSALRAATGAFQSASPLEAELFLERQRWDVIQSLKALHPFDRDGMVAYRLELQILERLARLREELGEPRYRETYAAILGAADTSPGVQT